MFKSCVTDAIDVIFYLLHDSRSRGEVVLGRIGSRPPCLPSCYHIRLATDLNH